MLLERIAHWVSVNSPRPVDKFTTRTKRVRRKTQKLDKEERRNEAISDHFKAAYKEAPAGQKELCEILDRRHAPLPNVERFRDAGGWSKAYEQQPNGAVKSWISKRAAKLTLPVLRPGPK